MKKQKQKQKGIATPIKNTVASPQGIAPTPFAERKSSLPIILSIGAILISLAGLANTLYQTSQTRKILRLHIKPEISCFVRQNTSSKLTNQPPLATELVILNQGKLKAVSIFAKYRIFVVDTNTLHVYVAFSPMPQMQVHDFSFIEPELEVGKGRIKSILGVGPMAIYVIDVEWYRETDMQRFTSQEIFLYESEQYLSHNQMKTRSDYKDIMHNLKVKMLADDVTFGNQQKPKSPSLQTKELDGVPPPFTIYHAPEDTRSLD